MGRSHESSAAKSWIRGIARFGLSAQGFIHLVVGVLAVQLATGLGGKTESLRSALSAIHEHWFGSTLLIVLALGFVSFAAWKIVQVAFDPEGIRQSKFGKLVRAGLGFSAVLYLGLAFTAVRVVFFGGDGGSAGENQRMESATATTLAQPGGRWLLAVVVLVLVSFAVGNIVHAWRAGFRDKLDQQRTRAGMIKLISALGRFAFAARGLVFFAAAWLFTQAALQTDSSQAGGSSAAMDELLRQPFGAWLLGAAGGGFIAFALFSWLLIRYLRLPG
jgi:hypothetical protein